MRTHCQTIDTRWEAIIIPTIRTEHPPYTGSLLDGLLPSDDTRTKGLVFKPQSPIFRDFVTRN